MRVARRAVGALLLASILLVGAAGHAVAASDTQGRTTLAEADRPQAQTADPATLAATQEFRLTPSRPGRVTVELRYSVPEPVVSLRSTIPSSARVRTTDGFERGSNRQYHWDGSTSAPSLTYSLPVNRTLNDSSPQGVDGEMVSVDAGSWALFRRPTTNTQYDHTDPVRFDLRRTTDGPGTVGEWLVYLGEYDVYERTAHDQRFRLVVPANANVAARPSTVLDSMTSAADGLRVGDRDDEVFVVAAPTDEVSWGVRGSHVGDADMWVRDAEPVDSADNAWLHEYVHSRQRLALDTEMLWFREASASYYAALLTFEQGRIDYTSFRERLAAGERSVYRDVDLTDHSTWNRYPQYERGALVAAEVDRQTRLASDGDRTLQTVFREMNEPQGRTTFAEFTGLVREYGSTAAARNTRQSVTADEDVSTWNASAHVEAFGPLPPRMTYRLPPVGEDGSYLILGPYRSSVVDGPAPIEVVPGERVALDAQVTNAGASAGEYSATLAVDGTVRDRTNGSLAAGQTTRVRLTHTFTSPGRYRLSVGDANVSVRVRPPADVHVGPFTAPDRQVRRGEAVEVAGRVENDASVPANGTVRITRNDELVATRHVALAPRSFETVSTEVRMEEVGENVVRVNGGDPIEIFVEESDVQGVTGTPTATATSPTATAMPTATTTGPEPTSTLPPAGQERTRTPPTTGDGGDGFGVVPSLAGFATLLGVLVRRRA